MKKLILVAFIVLGINSFAGDQNHTEKEIDAKDNIQVTSTISDEKDAWWMTAGEHDSEYWWVASYEDSTESDSE